MASMIRLLSLSAAGVGHLLYADVLFNLGVDECILSFEWTNTKPSLIQNYRTNCIIDGFYCCTTVVVREKSQGEGFLFTLFS